MDGYVVIGTELDTKKFDAQIKEVEYELKQIDYELSHAKELKLDSRTVEEYQSKAEKLTNKLVELRKKQEDLNKTDLSGAKSNLEGVGNTIEKVIGKVARWGLAVFGIRSAYMFIRQEMSTLTQYDDQLGTNVEWLRYLLASALKPVIEGLVNLAYKFLTYVNYIAQAWFGVNLFANATTEAFQKQNKTMGGTLKQAKELQKTLTGFDEMNILQKDGSVAQGGGGGGVTMPNFTPMEDVQIPKWVQWIADNKDKILDWAKLLAVAFGLIKIGKFLSNLGQAGEGLSKFGKKITNTVKEMGLWKTVGIAAMIAGAVLVAKNIYDLITKWDELDSKQKWIKVSLVALGDAFIVLGYTIKNGLNIATLGTATLIAAVVTLVTAVGSFIKKLFDEEKAILSTKDATEKLKNAKKELRDETDLYISAVDKEEEAHKRLIEAQNETGLSGQELYDQVKKGTLDYADMNEAQKRVYKAFVDEKNAQDDLTESKKKLKTATDNEKEATWKDILAKDAAKGKLEEYKNKVIDAYNKQEIKLEEAQKYLSWAMTEMDKDTQKTFAKNIPDAIKEGLKPESYKTTGQKFLDYMGSLWGRVKSLASVAWSGIKKHFGFSNGGVAYSSGFAKGGVVYHSLPKLAPGGIINQPGRGVPLGQAIGGERGAEGVIPLTNSQQMELLGEAIGRYITVNANITNTMNGRIISRELQKVQNDSDFAFNR